MCYKFTILILLNKYTFATFLISFKTNCGDFGFLEERGWNKEERGWNKEERE